MWKKDIYIEEWKKIMIDYNFNGWKKKKVKNKEKMNAGYRRRKKKEKWREEQNLKEKR